MMRVACVLVLLVFTWSTAQPWKEGTPVMMQEFAPLDWCRYVFLDVGSNIGIHARFLYEPELYPGQNYSKLFFDKYFPEIHRIKRKDICMVGFEPNPKHRKRLKRLQSYYQSFGLRAHWFFAGVGSHNGKKTFIRDVSDNGKWSNSANNDWGFRAISDQDSINNNNTALETDHLEIVRFAEFIRDKVLNRKIPDKFLATDPPPAIVAKIDIENEEYAVLKDLLSGDSSLFCAISAITIEYHIYSTRTRSIHGVPATAQQGHHQPIVEIEKEIASALAKRPCGTNVVQYDCERYRFDTPTGIQRLQHHRSD